MCGANATVRGVLKEIPSDFATVIFDLEASPEHMTRGTTRHLDHILLVAEPYFKSLETARRYHRLATDLGIPNVSVVGNKVPAGEEDVVEEFCDANGFSLLGSIPFDPSFTEAERAGTAPIDHAPGSPGVEAIRGLAKSLLERT